MASQQEDDIHEGTPGYTLSQPKQSLATYQQMVLLAWVICTDRGIVYLYPSSSHEMAAFVRSRSVSLSIPAPPPPSPYAYDLGEHDAQTGSGACSPAPMLVPDINLDELLQLLYAKGLAAWRPSASAAAPVPNATAATVAAVPIPIVSGSETSDSSDSSCTSAFGATVATDAVKNKLLTLPGPSGSVPVAHSAAPPATVLACLDNSSADANDESLQKYKASLGLGAGKDLSDPNDPRVCIIQSLTMESPGRDPVTIDLSVPGSEATLKDHPFTIKEGARFTMVATFKVQHEVLSGLRYVQVVKRKGVRVSKDSEMIGSYAPNTDKQPLYTKRFQEDEAPSGMLVRGHYVANSSFIDDDKKTHLAFEWSFDISKDW